MPTLRTSSQITQYVKRQLLLSLEDDGNRAGKQKLEESIAEYVYQRPESDSYDRTYEFLRSVDSEILRGTSTFRIAFFNNPLMMDPHPSWNPEKFGYNQNESLAYWINYGHGGYTDVAETLYLENAKREIYKVFKPTMILALRKRGIKAT